jgi:DNA adenine methylase
MTTNTSTTQVGSLTPPLKWHGGKHYLARHVLELMPGHLHYVEPYFGGGQVLFARDPKDPRYFWGGLTSDKRKADGVSEVINDLHRDLMGFYSVVKDESLFTQLQRRLYLTNNMEAEWQDARDHLAGPDGDPVVRAADLFIFCRQSLSARMTSFAPTVRTRLRGGRNDNVNAWCNAIDGLQAVHERLRSVRVLCRPALDVIRQEDEPTTLFYLDPPYLHETRTARKVYAYEMSEAQHRELLNVLLAVKGKVILSGYASTLYDAALAGWARHTVDLPNNAASGKSKDRETEVLWCNF